MLRFLLVLSLLGFAGSKAFAQACCSGGVPITSNLGLGSSEKNSLPFLFSYDLNFMDDLRVGKARLDDNSRLRMTHSILLEGNYALGKKWFVSGLFSWVKQARQIRSIFGNEDFVSASGPGDLVFLVKYKLLKGEKGPEWLLGLGPKIPLGRANLKDNIGITLPADLQPGTGSWDGIAWTWFRAKHIWKRNLNFSTVVTYKMNGTNQRYNGNLNYRFGHELMVSAGFRHRFLFYKLLVDPALSLRFRHVGSDRVQGELFPNSGGTWLFLVPGFALNFSKDFALRFSANLPLYRYLDGTQLTTTFRTSVALYYNLRFKKKS